MLKKLKDLAVDDQFTMIDEHTVYKVTMLLPSTKQLLAYDIVNNRYCIFTVYGENKVKVVTDDPLCMTGKYLKAGDKFLWSDRIDSHIKTVVYATDEWIVYKLTQENERIHYSIIYKGSIGWENKIKLCE